MTYEYNALHIHNTMKDYDSIWNTIPTIDLPLEYYFN